MSISTLISEMIVIFAMIAVGYAVRKTGHATDSILQPVSFLVSYICNPVLTVSVALSYEGRLAVADFFANLKWSILLYAILIIASYIIPAVLRIPKRKRFIYHMLTVYGNTGFIGLPICRAVFGVQSLVFITISNIFSCCLIYTYALSVLRKAKKLQDMDKADGDASAVTTEDVSFFHNLKRIVNAGTISSMIAMVIYLTDPQVPTFVKDIASYIGEPAIFLSMFVLGCTVAASPLKSFFSCDRKTYIFLAVRMLLLPICVTLLLKQLIPDNAMLLGTLTVMVSLPGANLPLILAQEMGLESSELSRGIILTTILCLVTIPAVALVL